MFDGKVFCIGMSKTGTTSLKRALEAFGFGNANTYATYRNIEWPPLLEEARQGNFENVVATATKFQVFFDRPWNITPVYEHVSKTFPNARFILTRRDPKTWWRSARRWISGRPHLLDSYKLQLEANDFVEEQFVAGYLRHNTRVRRLFDESPRLLVLDVELPNDEKAAKLSAFLDATLPSDFAYPHTNCQP